MILNAHCITRRLHETQGLKLVSADQEMEKRMRHPDHNDGNKKWTFDRFLDIGFWIVFCVFAYLVVAHARPY
jgi:hypothetical protein